MSEDQTTAACNERLQKTIRLQHEALARYEQTIRVQAGQIADLTVKQTTPKCKEDTKALGDVAFTLTLILWGLNSWYFGVMAFFSILLVFLCGWFARADFETNKDGYNARTK